MRVRLDTVLCAIGLAVGASAVHGQRPTAKPAATQASAAAAVPAPARPDAANLNVPFRPGESLTYDVSWSSYLTAGTATLAVKDIRPAGGSTAYYIVGEGKPTGVVSTLYSLYYKADTLLDTRSLLPHQGSIYSQEGSRQRTKLTRFDHAAQRVTYEVKAPNITRSSPAVPKYTQDVLSAVYALRAVPLKENAGFSMPVCDSGKVYRVRFTIGRIESVRAGSATVPAYRVTPVVTDAGGRTVGRPIRLWISTDARRAPVRVEADLAVGNVTLTLR